jgi:hypothetical protein
MGRQARERTEINRTFNVEQWFLERVDAHLRNQPSGERTPQCVGDAFLRSYAEAPSRLSLSDPRVEHVSSCSYCIRSYLEIRNVQRQHNPSLSPPWHRDHRLLAALTAACLMVVIVATAVWSREHLTPSQGQTPELRETLDLSQDGTYRGEQPATVPRLSLPAALVRLELILPRLSNPGNYFVAIAPNESGRYIIGSARGVAAGADARTVLTVTLDLRRAKPGTYILSTERDGEGGPYFYPLTIQTAAKR